MNAVVKTKALKFFPNMDPEAVVETRFDGVFLMDVEDGNPQGDPDNSNNPRVDQDGFAIITDSGIKRRIRDYVESVRGSEQGLGIWMRRGVILGDAIEEAREKAGLAAAVSDEKEKGKKKIAKAKGTDEIEATKSVMLRDHFDVRAFGGLMAYGPGAGKVRGPVQMFIARSVDPVDVDSIGITRTSGSNKEDAEQTMGTRHMIRYSLFRCPFAINPFDAKKSGFTYRDFDLFLEALVSVPDSFWSGCSSGRRTCRGLVLFQHDGALGRARSADLQDLVSIEKNPDVERPSSYNDYSVTIGEAPEGVEVLTVVNPVTKKK
jgi:CRISPR-associated protein Csd2